MSKRPTSADFSPPLEPSETDRRLDSPVFHRNGNALVDALAPRLSNAQGTVLEVGSGTGQHIALFALSFPHLGFQPSDPEPARCASIDAWRAHFALETMHAAIDLDVAAEDWPLDSVGAQAFCALFCANVIHVADWSASDGLMRGAAARLTPDGFLGLYGPFRWHGRHNSEGNRAFDARLRARDPDWGVRDVDDIDRLAVSNGLERVETVDMPANNHLLIFERVSPARSA